MAEAFIMIMFVCVIMAMAWMVRMLFEKKAEENIAGTSTIVTAIVVQYDGRFNPTGTVTYALMCTTEPESVRYYRVTAKMAFSAVPIGPGTYIAKIRYDLGDPKKEVKILNVLQCNFGALQRAINLQIAAVQERP